MHADRTLRYRIRRPMTNAEIARALGCENDAGGRIEHAAVFYRHAGAGRIERVGVKIDNDVFTVDAGMTSHHLAAAKFADVLTNS